MRPFVLVRPDAVVEEEAAAVAGSTRDLETAFARQSQGLGDLAVAQSLKGAGYLSVDGFQVVEE